MKRKYRILPVFIPFYGCKSRCVYCNQTVITRISDDNIISSVAEQIAVWCQRGGHWDELGFYGGSFLHLPKTIRLKLYAMADGIPIRISACPDVIPNEFFDEITDYDIKTVELGIQSFSDEVLRLNGRNYTSAQALDTINTLAPKVNLSLQFMAGMYGETEKDILHTTNIAANLKIPKKYARIYPTLVLPETELERLYLQGKYIPPSAENIFLRTVWLYLSLEVCGYRVIRMGLPPEVQGGNVLGGYWHPSFGDLVRRFVLQRCGGFDTIQTLWERYKNEGDLWFTEKSNVDLAKRFVGAPHV